MGNVEPKWCVFGLALDSVGKVGRDNGSSLHLVYCEGQYYPWECWDPKYVRRFMTPEEAISEACRRSGDSPSEMSESFLQNFPSVKSLDMAAIRRNLKRTRHEHKH